MQQQQLYDQQPEENVNIQEILEKYLQHWKWILLFTILSCGIAFLYLKSQPSTYKSKATVLVKDDKKGNLPSDFDIFSDIGITKGNSNLHNEIEMFKSRDLVKEVVKNLALNTQLTEEKGVLSPDKHYYHNNTPLLFEFKDSAESLLNKSFFLILSDINKNNFSVLQKYVENGEEHSSNLGKFKYGEAFNTRRGALVVLKTENFNKDVLNSKLTFKYTSLLSATDRWRAKFEVNTINKDASVLELSATGLMKQANNDFIKQLIIEHEENAISDKNEITKNTSAFIAERMKVIEEELSTVEEINEKFKSENQITDIEKDAEVFLEQKGGIESQIVETNIQLNLAKFMADYLEKQDNIITLLPANLGFADQNINVMTQNYNKLVMERNKLIEGSSKNNPLAVQIENQLESLKTSITQSLNNTRKSMALKLQELNKESLKFRSKIADIPEFERRYREIQRQQQIKETLYLYLLQKREENEIAMASTIGNVKIIDAPYAINQPVGPKKNIVLLAAFILGIAIPIAFIYLKDLLDNKVRDLEELEDTGVSVAGDIPQNKSKEILVAKKGERTVISEAYRMLRTNMRFLLEKKTEEGQVIFLSSTLPSEGKTFTSINLANSIALTNKKVVLVGLDLRAPKLSQYLNHEKEFLGVSNYLSNPDIGLNTLIHSANNEMDFDYIFSGDIPPNPSELLTRSRVEEFFNELKNKYDFIVVDTSPMALVVDTVSILEHADLLLYVVKANFAHKNSLEIPIKLKEEKKVKKIALILNGSNPKKGGYGYGGYKYGYGEPYGSARKKKSWFSFLKR